MAGSPGHHQWHDGPHGEHNHADDAERRRHVVGRLLHPHRHDPVESIDPILESSRQGMRALSVSLAVLGVTAGIQAVIVTASGSVALLADTIHNGADALTAVPLGVAFWAGRRPATRAYTYGYGRGEDLAGIAIVAIVALSAGLAGWEAVERLIHPERITHIGWVITAGFVGFCGNELVAHHRIRVGRTIGSAALEADGYHARTDGVTSLGVVVGALGVAAGWQGADALVGLAITVAIVIVVKNAARDIYRRLMDAVDPAVVDRVTQVLAATPGIQDVDAVRVRWIGHALHLEAEVTSASELSLSRAHDIAEEARHALFHQIPRMRSATIHSGPASASVDPHARTAHHARPLLAARAHGRSHE